MKTCSKEGCCNKYYGKGLCRKHYQQQPHVVKAKLEWQHKNKEKRKQILQRYHASEKHKKTVKKYRNTDKGHKNKIMGWQNYHTQKLNAMPKWVDKEEIRKIYQNCPKGYHVDHIMPLRGKNSCGLHVLWNLQYLIPKENIKKGNRV